MATSGSCSALSQRNANTVQCRAFHTHPPPHPYPADAGPPSQNLACVKGTGDLDLCLYNLPVSWVEITGVLDFPCRCQTEPLPSQACSVRAAASRRTPLGIRTLITKLSFSTLPLHRGEALAKCSYGHMFRQNLQK